MKVLHIAPDYPHSKLYHQLISSLEREGCKNSVYVQEEDAHLERNYPVFYLGRSFGVLDRLLFFRKQHIIKNDIIKHSLVEGVDVIHAHNLFSAGYNAMKLKRRYGIPYIVAIRNTDVNVFFHYMVHLRWLGVRIMKEADAIIFLSPAYRDNVIYTFVPLLSRGEILDKSYIIPNGLDPYFMDNRATQPRRLADKKSIRFIYAGDVDKNKNVRTTIKACELLIKGGYDVSLDVVGRIKDKSQDSIKDICFVNYHSYSPKEKVREYFKESDIFVMPSIHETFGLVYIEAMSQGLPVIYSQGQGFDGYYKEGKVGYHVPCFDEKAICDSVIKIISNYTEMSETCIEAVKDFSWDKKAEEYKAIYMKVTKK